MFCYFRTCSLFFLQCRPPGIYKQDYLTELNLRYGDPKEPLHAPERPDWCYEDEVSDEDDDGDRSESRGHMSDGSSLDGRRKRRRRDPRVKVSVESEFAKTTAVVNCH